VTPSPAKFRLFDIPKASPKMVSQETTQTPVTFRLNHPKRGGHQSAKISGLAPMPQSPSCAGQRKQT